MKKILSLLTLLLISVNIFTCCAAKSVAYETSVSDNTETSSEISARVNVDGTKFVVNGKELWINGANTPWQTWNDFAGNMDVESWENTFKELKAENINCTRIWVNCNGLSSIQLKTTGEFKAVSEGHWTDLDKLFDLAEKYDIYVMPTLLSFDHFKQPNVGYEYWRKMITSKENTDQFVENYVVEFAKRYKDYEHIFAIDIMNEPDWVFENDESGKIPWENLSYFFGKCASAIHENSDILVTVGLGMIKYNSDNYNGNMISDTYMQELTGDDKAFVDFYSTHFYMWEKPYYGFPFDKSPIDFGLDGTKPCIIGETSNDDENESGMSAKDKYLSCYEKGWNGIMVWMEYRTDGSSGCDSLWYRYDLTKEATNAMYDSIPDIIFPNGKTE